MLYCELEMEMVWSWKMQQTIHELGALLVSGRCVCDGKNRGGCNLLNIISYSPPAVEAVRYEYS